MTVMLYRHPGPHRLHGDWFDYVVVAAAEVPATIARYEYHVQCALYRDAVRQTTGDDAMVVLLFIEDDEPFVCCPYYVPESMLTLGRTTYLERIVRYKQCLESGKWPRYTDAQGKEDLLEAALPKWYTYQHAGPAE